VSRERKRRRDPAHEPAGTRISIVARAKAVHPRYSLSRRALGEVLSPAHARRRVLLIGAAIPVVIRAVTALLYALLR
jgi:hypothetical protein